MSKNVVTIAPSSNHQEEAREVVKRKISCLPLLEGDRLIGIVAETDILRHVAAS